MVTQNGRARPCPHRLAPSGPVRTTFFGRKPHSTGLEWSSANQEICLFSLIYLFTCLLICISTDSWIFILYFGLEYSTILLGFLFKLFQLWPLWALLCWPLCPFNTFPLPTPFFWALLCFLPLQDAPGSSCRFARAQALESAILSRSPGLFYYRTVLETKIQAFRGLLINQRSPSKMYQSDGKGSINREEK